jgi:hypothetical protein
MACILPGRMCEKNMIGVEVTDYYFNNPYIHTKHKQVHFCSRHTQNFSSVVFTKTTYVEYLFLLLHLFLLFIQVKPTSNQYHIHTHKNRTKSGLTYTELWFLFLTNNKRGIALKMLPSHTHLIYVMTCFVYTIAHVCTLMFALFKCLAYTPTSCCVTCSGLHMYTCTASPCEWHNRCRHMTSDMCCQWHVFAAWLMSHDTSLVCRHVNMIDTSRQMTIVYSCHMRTSCIYTYTSQSPQLWLSGRLPFMAFLTVREKYMQRSTNPLSTQMTITSVHKCLVGLDVFLYIYMYMFSQMRHTCPWTRERSFLGLLPS